MRRSFAAGRASSSAIGGAAGGRRRPAAGSAHGATRGCAGARASWGPEREARATRRRGRAHRPSSVDAGVEDSAGTAGVVGGAVYGGAVAMRSRRRIASAGGACRCVSLGRNTPVPPFGFKFAVAPSRASAGSSAPTRASRSRVGCAARKASSAGMSTADFHLDLGAGGEEEEDPPGVGVLGMSGRSVEEG
ncbi:hypothetical protein B0H11DRAFT_2065894 [Mycena galericulata]|nr:hypothetical protein B0H11DRAFT_2065894 [Mycena galericulata]